MGAEAAQTLLPVSSVEACSTLGARGRHSLFGAAQRADGQKLVTAQPGGTTRGAGTWQPRLVAAQAAAPPAPAAAPGPAAAAPAGDVVVAVRGSGSTAVQSLMTAVLGNFTKQLPQASLTYDAVGSGQGAAARRRRSCSPRAALKQP
jgi:hypothetical protein